MAGKRKERARVASQRLLAPGIYDMRIATDLAKDARCGQFVALYPKDKSTLLPRPISICEADRQAGELRLVYRVAGKGTAEFSHLQAGDSVDLLGVLGNGFPADRAQRSMTAALLGGGIGVPPLLELAKELDCDRRIVVGYRDSQCFLREDFEAQAPGHVYIATEDGSVGTKGNVMDALRENGIAPDILFACGPLPMLRAVKQYAIEQGILAYLSLEERMACGVGACLGCVCKTAGVDPHSHVHNARVCTDGPVFEAREVEI